MDQQKTQDDQKLFIGPVFRRSARHCMVLAYHWNNDSWISSLIEQVNEQIHDKLNHRGIFFQHLRTRPYKQIYNPCLQILANLHFNRGIFVSC